SQNRPAELSLFRRHGRAPAAGQAGGPDRKFGAAGLAEADHGYPEEGGGRRIFGGDPLLQRRPQAAPAGEGRDGPLHGGGCPRLRRRAQATGGLDTNHVAGLGLGKSLTKTERRKQPNSGRAEETPVTIQQNTDHIQTTHIGSLPRPHNLLDLLKAKYAGLPYDESELNSILAQEVAECVRKHVECGIEIVTDGEYSKPGFFTYIRERFDGFDARPNLKLTIFQQQGSAFLDYCHH